MTSVLWVRMTMLIIMRMAISMTIKMTKAGSRKRVEKEKLRKLSKRRDRTKGTDC